MAEGRPKKIALVGATGYQYESTEARVESGEGQRLDGARASSEDLARTIAARNSSSAGSAA